MEAEAYVATTACVRSGVPNFVEIERTWDFAFPTPPAGPAAASAFDGFRATNRSRRTACTVSAPAYAVPGAGQRLSVADGLLTV